MHRLGVLKDEDLIAAYMDLGYDKEHAERMAEFTIEYNKDVARGERTAKDERHERNRDLSKTDILKGYSNRLITKEDCLNLLVSIGYDEMEAKYLTSLQDYHDAQDEVDTQIKIYHDAYVKGVMAFNDVITKLGELNLPDSYVQRQMGRWQIEREARANKPTKSELLGFWTLGIIDEETLKAELRSMNYSEKYIEWYITAWKRKQELKAS